MTLEQAAKAVEVSCFHSFSIQKPGSPAVLQLLRASPDYRGSPWYDFVEVNQKNGGSCVAKLLVIVSIKWHTRTSDCEPNAKKQKTEAHERLVAFVEFYNSALSREKDSVEVDVKLDDDTPAVRDLTERHRYAGIPVVKLEPDQSKRYALLDTSAITGGLYVQQGFKDPRARWVVRLV